MKDLMYRATVSSNIPGFYYNDFSHPDMEKRHEEFSIEKAFQLCLNMRNTINKWEELRVQKLGVK